MTVFDADGNSHRGLALIGADGGKSVVRQQLAGEPVRMSGHVVYRTVVDAQDFPADLRWNAPAIWVGPNCHLVHYLLIARRRTVQPGPRSTAGIPRSGA